MNNTEKNYKYILRGSNESYWKLLNDRMRVQGKETAIVGFNLTNVQYMHVWNIIVKSFGLVNIHEKMATAIIAILAFTEI